MYRYGRMMPGHDEALIWVNIIAELFAEHQRRERS